MRKSNGRDGKPRDVGKIMREGTLIDRALRKAARQAREAHRRAGKPLVVWERGKAKLVRP